MQRAHGWPLPVTAGPRSPLRAIIREIKSLGDGNEAMIEYSIDVNARELTRVLKRLHKMGKGEQKVFLQYVAGKLTKSLGSTSEEISSNGTWPGLVSAPGKWVKMLAAVPFEAAITDLQVHDGKLWARNNGTLCTVNENGGVAPVTGAGRKTRRAGS